MCAVRARADTFLFLGGTGYEFFATVRCAAERPVGVQGGATESTNFVIVLGWRKYLEKIECCEATFRCPIFDAHFAKWRKSARPQPANAQAPRVGAGRGCRAVNPPLVSSGRPRGVPWLRSHWASHASLATRRHVMSCHAMPRRHWCSEGSSNATERAHSTEHTTSNATANTTQHTLTQHMLATIQPQPRHDITAQYALVALHRCAAQSGTRSDRRRHGRRHGLGRRLRYCGPREAPRYVAPIRRRVGGPFGSGDPR